ncbi:MAG: hypothetical protein U0807_08490 [Candidatus Binatia bacterium]
MAGGADFSAVSRRWLLKYSLGAAGFALMGGAGGLLAIRGGAPAVAGLRWLTAQEHRTLAALAGALYPPSPAFPVGANDVHLVSRIDAFVADLAPWDQRDLRRAIVLLEYGPVLFERRATTFRHLAEEERAAHFARWSVSDSQLRREVAVAFRRLLALMFFDRPEVWPHVGYDGPYLTRE